MQAHHECRHTPLAPIFLLLSLGAGAGELDSPGTPSSAAAQMYTVEDIYSRLDSGATGSKASSFTEPVSGPSAGTMHTLNDIMAKAPVVDDDTGATAADVASGKSFWGLTSGGWGLQSGAATIKPSYPAPVARTGARVSFLRNDDADWLAGVRRTGVRFVDNGDGTVTDQLTGLVWLTNAKCSAAAANWSTALSFVAELNSAGSMDGNDCGDTSNGGSHQSDWRLPNINELRSLLDAGNISPTVRSDHPFIDIYDTNDVASSGVYWTSTTAADGPNRAWKVDFRDGAVHQWHGKPDSSHVWAVRADGANAPAPVPKTGQTLCYDTDGVTISCDGTGQDGELQEGVAWPDPRFTDNDDGTVTDNLTGLIWLQDASCLGSKGLVDAHSDFVVDALKDGGCGLSDGSAAGDWRLPNRNELASLIDYGRSGPALPEEHPFENVAPTQYWSFTNLAIDYDPTNYIRVSLDTGRQDSTTYFRSLPLWAVRGGE